MKLLLVRHTNSQDRSEFAGTGKDDSHRPITEEGREVMRECSISICSIVDNPGQIVASPFTRARQTAEILHQVSESNRPLLESETLVPSAMPEEFEDWVAEQDEFPMITAVGHNPHLPRLITWFLSGTPRQIINVKKASATLLTFPSVPEKATGILRWSLTPDQLRAMAGT